MKAKTKGKPTIQEKNILAAIRVHQKNHGRPPTHEEIGDTLGIAKQTARFHLRNLRKKGWVDWDRYKARTLRLL